MLSTIEKALNLYLYKITDNINGVFIIRKNITPTRINTIKTVRVELFYKYKSKTKSVLCVTVVNTINIHSIKEDDVYKLIEVQFLTECIDFINNGKFKRLLNGEDI